MPELKAETIKRVVVRGANWVGDAVMTVPALRELRRLLPNSHITLATHSWAQGLFADADFIDDLLIFDRRGLWSVAQQIRAWAGLDFSLGVIFPNSFEAALIPALARVPFRLGYATQARSMLLTTALPLPEWHNSRHEIYYYLNIVAELERLLKGKPRPTVFDPKPDCSLDISAPRKAEALNNLRARGVREGRPIVALCPGSINSRAKRWPAQSYAAVGDLLVEGLGANILLVGSSAELDVALEVKKQMSNEPVMLTGETDLFQAVAVLSQVDLLITNDTGPAHIAAALGRPTLVIFGPTNPLTTRPFSAAAEIVRRAPDCAPCMLRDCPIDHRCMTAISPEEVFERARVLLAGKEVVAELLDFEKENARPKFIGQV